MSETASADLLRLLAATAREPDTAHAELFAVLGLADGIDRDTLRGAHAQAFITQCVPYASIYVGAEGGIGGEAADRVAGFRRVLGAEVDAMSSKHAGHAADYLPDLLADYAELVAMADDSRAAHARKAMLWEHLLCWLMPFCDALGRSAPPPYDDWAAMAARVFRAEAEATGCPGQLALHLRAAPNCTIGADAESPEAAARTLLVPAATGLVLTRADLARAANAVHAPVVPGSRAFMLGTLFDQDPGATLNWLAAEAARQADARQSEQPALGASAEFWISRARASRDALAGLADLAAGASSSGRTVFA